MTEQKESIKKFLTALSNDDYVGADKEFPNVVKSTLTTIINNKKVTVLQALNKNAEEIASKSIEKKKDATEADKQ
jgi:hypothetical protein